MPLRLFGQNQSLILGSSPNALEIGMEEESVLIRKGETAVGNLLAVDVPEELTRRHFKDVYFADTWGYILDPTVGLVANDWDSTAENFLKPKNISVPFPATDITTDDGLVFRYLKNAKAGDSFYPNGIFMGLYSHFYAAGNPIIMAVVDQLGGLASDKVITTASDGSAMDITRLLWDHIRTGPNKDSLRYSPDMNTDDKTGHYFENPDGVPDPSTLGEDSVPIDPLNLPAALVSVVNGAGTAAEKLIATKAIDWSKRIGNHWAAVLPTEAYFKLAGASLDFTTPGELRTSFPIMQLYKSYEEDPSYVAGM